MQKNEIAELKIRLDVMELMLINLYVVDSMTHDVDPNVLREAFIENVAAIVTTLPVSQEALWVQDQYDQQIDRIFALIQQILRRMANRRGQ